MDKSNERKTTARRTGTKGNQKATSLERDMAMSIMDKTARAQKSEFDRDDSRDAGNEPKNG